MRFRILLAAPLIAGVALLSACGGSDNSSSDASDASTKTYLQLVKATGGSFATDDDAIAAGKQVCSDFESGKSMLEITAGLESKAGGKAQAAAVVGAAVGTFCPDQQTKVTAGS